MAYNRQKAKGAVRVRGVATPVGSSEKRRRVATSEGSARPAKVRRVNRPGTLSVAGKRGRSGGAVTRDDYTFFKAQRDLSLLRKRYAAKLRVEERRYEQEVNRLIRRMKQTL